MAINTDNIPESKVELEWILEAIPDHVRNSRDINLGVSVQEVLESIWKYKTQVEVQKQLGFSAHSSHISKFIAKETGYDVTDIRGAGAGCLKGKFLILIKSLMRQEMDCIPRAVPSVNKKTVTRSSSDIREEAWARKLFVVLSAQPWCTLERNVTEADTLAVIKQLNLV